MGHVYPLLPVRKLQQITKGQGTTMDIVGDSSHSSRLYLLPSGKLT